MCVCVCVCVCVMCVYVYFYLYICPYIHISGKKFGSPYATMFNSEPLDGGISGDFYFLLFCLFALSGFSTL